MPVLIQGSRRGRGHWTRKLTLLIPVLLAGPLLAPVVYPVQLDTGDVLYSIRVQAIPEVWPWPPPGWFHGQDHFSDWSSTILSFRIGRYAYVVRRYPKPFTRR